MTSHGSFSHSSGETRILPTWLVIEILPQHVHHLTHATDETLSRPCSGLDLALKLQSAASFVPPSPIAHSLTRLNRLLARTALTRCWLTHLTRCSHRSLTRWALSPAALLSTSPSAWCVVLLSHSPGARCTTFVTLTRGSKRETGGKEEE
jgi:hypothetical protein